MTLKFEKSTGVWTLYFHKEPPREEVYQAIEDCKTAEIRVMVIVGENKNIVEAICLEIGVFTPN
ncbi:hypothetical protein RYX36_027547 [Vicia faba]